MITIIVGKQANTVISNRKIWKTIQDDEGNLCLAFCFTPHLSADLLQLLSELYLLIIGKSINTIPQNKHRCSLCPVVYVCLYCLVNSAMLGNSDCFQMWLVVFLPEDTFPTFSASGEC